MSLQNSRKYSKFRKCDRNQSTLNAHVKFVFVETKIRMERYQKEFENHLERICQYKWTSLNPRPLSKDKNFKQPPCITDEFQLQLDISFT